MNSRTEVARQKAWSAYWAAGALHSCADSFVGNYSGVIAEFWKPRFKSLMPQSTVLDLATGNGALPLLLWECRQGLDDVHVDAVDLAQVSPGWHQQDVHRNITFHPGVAMEQLPFADATFDLAVSQFGLEYAQWPAALHEILRVSRPHGSAAFVMHHPQSIIVQVGREELKNLEFLLRPDGLLDAARRVMPWMAHASAGRQARLQDPEAAAGKQAYNLAASLISQQIDASPVPDLLLEVRASVHSLLKGITAAGCDTQMEQLENLGHALREAALRAAELVEHAVDRQRLNNLVELFQAARPTHRIVCEPIAQEEGILGWSVLLQPQAS